MLKSIRSVILEVRTQVFQGSFIRLTSPPTSNWCIRESLNFSPVDQHQNRHSEYSFQGCQSRLIELGSTSSIQRFGTADPDSKIAKVNVSSPEIVVLAIAKSWKHRGYSPCGWKDTAPSWLQVLLVSKRSKHLGKVDALMYAHGTVGKIAFYCTAVQNYAPILLSSEASKSNDHDDCGPYLEMYKKSSHDLGPKAR